MLLRDVGHLPSNRERKTKCIRLKENRNNNNFFNVSVKNARQCISALIECGWAAAVAVAVAAGAVVAIAAAAAAAAVAIAAAAAAAATAVAIAAAVATAAWRWGGRSVGLSVAAGRHSVLQCFDFFKQIGLQR